MIFTDKKVLYNLITVIKKNGEEQGEPIVKIHYGVPSALETMGFTSFEAFKDFALPLVDSGYYVGRSFDPAYDTYVMCPNSVIITPLTFVSEDGNPITITIESEPFYASPRTARELMDLPTDEFYELLSAKLD